jgi:hypothetical protein
MLAFYQKKNDKEIPSCVKKERETFLFEKNYCFQNRIGKFLEKKFHIFTNLKRKKPWR